jgi:hypothetical protein
MPNYYTADNVNLGIRATLNGKKHAITSATVSVWDAVGNTLRVNAAAMTVSADEATYQVATSVTDEVGTYRVEYTVTLSDGQGVLSAQDTFEVLVRFS